MRPVADLLRTALRIGDEQGRVQVKGEHLPDDVMADLVTQTHLYALEHADETVDGWLVFHESIASWRARPGLFRPHLDDVWYGLSPELLMLVIRCARTSAGEPSEVAGEPRVRSG